MTIIQSVGSTSNGPWGVSVGDSPLVRSAPEPRSLLGSWGHSTTSAVASAATSLAGIGAGFLDGGGDIASLLNRQIQIQQEMQTVSMASNIARSQHETEMAPIRNMRVG